MLRFYGCAALAFNLRRCPSGSAACESQKRAPTSMAQKPPAFQFYARDWLSSPTVRKMSPHLRGIYIDLLAAAWNSEEPGTLPLPLDFAARSAGLDIRSLRDFMAKSPRCFVEVGGKLVNEKLHNQWLSYRELSEKRSEAAKSRYSANTLQVHHSASASSSASATAKSKEESRAQNSRPVLNLPSEISRTAKVKTLTPQQKTYSDVNRLSNEALRLYAQGQSAGDVKENLKQWAANNGIAYDATIVCRALDIADASKFAGTGPRG